MRIIIPRGEKSNVVVANDFHIPNHDPMAVELFLKFIKDIQPDILVLNGDVIDCYEISDFSKSAWVTQAFQDECRQVEEFLDKLWKCLPDSRIIYIAGNHEFRLQRYISRNAKEIYFLDGLRLENILYLGGRNIEYVNAPDRLAKFADNYIQINELYIGHFNKVNKHASYTAKNLVEDKGVSLIQGHTHRGGMFYKTTIDGMVLTGMENFCMCDTNPVYLNNANWQHGFCVVHIDAPDFYIQPIHMENYKFYYGNKLYE